MMSGRSRVLFGLVFKRLSYGDQTQLVRRAVAETAECLAPRNASDDDVAGIKRRIRYLVRRAREFGIEATT
jgi:hypothetical protein